MTDDIKNGELPGSKCELKIWRERSKKDGTRETVTVDDLGTDDTFDTNYAIVVRQILTDKNIFDKTKVTINSPQLLKVFRDVIKSHPTVPVDFTEPFEMESPFQMLLHSWDLLEKTTEESEDDEQRMHLNLLLSFMRSDMGKERKTLQQYMQKGAITFDTLWSIFRPGDTAVTYAKTQPWLLEVVKTAYEENKAWGKFLEVHCVHTDYDGENVGEAKTVVNIIQKRNFAQENPSPIREMPIIPRRFVNEDSGLEERLTKRGEQFLSYRGMQTRKCVGGAEHLREQPPDFWHPDMESFPLIWEGHAESGRVILDRGRFRKENFQDPVAPEDRSSDYHKSLCPPYVHGYSISRQEWCRFYLPTLSEIAWNDNAFENLILPEKQNKLIRAVVTSHQFPEEEISEAESKGKGLVVLLHGPPGSGKTLTAECAAEATHRPLISVSAQSLNKFNRPYWFEYELRNVLRLATIWKAVILFDEADIFLEARDENASTGDSSTRNALVAIFLRHLEYFAGIVFLTTNRIRVFDAAMRSRVHLALGYSAPGVDSRAKIWKHCLQKIDKADVGFDVDEVADRLAHEKLNGREISNAIGTATTIARHDQVPLDMSHIDSVIGIWRDFLSNLGQMRTAASGSSKDPNGVNFVPHVIRKGSILTEEPESV